MKITFRKKPRLQDERRQALERWVRWRFRMLDGDHLAAVTGAVARLTSEGMRQEDARETVAKILQEEVRRIE